MKPVVPKPAKKVIQVTPITAKVEVLTKKTKEKAFKITKTPEKKVIETPWPEPEVQILQKLAKDKDSKSSVSSSKKDWSTFKIKKIKEKSKENKKVNTHTGTRNYAQKRSDNHEISEKMQKEMQGNFSDLLLLNNNIATTWYVSSSIISYSKETNGLQSEHSEHRENLIEVFDLKGRK